MVTYRMELDEEKRRAAIEVALESPDNVRRRKIGGRVLVALGALLALESLLLLAMRGPSGPRIALLLLGAAALGFGVRARAWQRFVMRRAERLLDESLRSGVASYSFDDDGVTIDSRLGHSLCFWPSFREWGTKGPYLYLRRADNRLVLVERGALSQDELAELLRLLEAHVGPSGGGNAA